MSNTYYVKVYQPEDWPLVEVQIRRDKSAFGGCINAQRIARHWAASKLETKINPNVTFGTTTPAGADDIIDWWRIAAATARSLEGLVETVEDLKRPVVAKVVGRSVVVNFADEERTE
jgi:hypothetical protein